MSNLVPFFIVNGRTLAWVCKICKQEFETENGVEADGTIPQTVYEQFDNHRCEILFAPKRAA